jgi:aryl-alcohol dehydrogenase-like predicted oxidoreductase
MNYHLLGKTGLRVSPLALGTMTFGTDWGWGTSEDTARNIFNAYVETGGNFVDTADLYTNGTSETLVGKFIQERSLRDKVVLATKYTFNAQPGNPNAGGNGRKNLYRAIEGSLKRLGTDYIDLFWVHAWDTLTPVEEVIQSLNTLVESGKVRYIGLSDCPAWYVSRAQTLAELRGWERVSALQLEYNLIERSIENEFVPMVQELGMGICVWSPLANGFLSGKYARGQMNEGRLKEAQGPGSDAFKRIVNREKNWEIVEVLKSVAKQIDRSPAQVALNWVAKRPGVSATLIGATKIDQLQANLRAIDFDLPTELRQKLNQVSALEPATPYTFFNGPIHDMTTGGANITREPSWFRGGV